MNPIKKLHKEAMDLAEIAFVAKLRGDLTHANQLFRQALEKESQAASLVPNESFAQPTRSILYRSAATLTLDCQEWREAERLIAARLTGEPPEEIAEELRESRKKCKAQEHRPVINNGKTRKR